MDIASTASRFSVSSGGGAGGGFSGGGGGGGAEPFDKKLAKEGLEKAFPLLQYVV